MVNSINTIREAFDRWKGALVDQDSKRPAPRATALTRVSRAWKT